MANLLKKLNNDIVAGAYICRDNGIALGVVTGDKGSRVIEAVACMTTKRCKTVLEVDKKKLEGLGITLNIIDEETNK